MLKAILVDDEKHALTLLGKMIGERNDVRVIGAYTDPSAALEAAGGLVPDVIFLDVDMPEMSGLEAAKQLRKLPGEIEVVFVTAHRQYALDAFGVDALDYLLKPVEPELLDRTFERLLRRKRPGRYADSGNPDAYRIRCFGGFDIARPERQSPLRFPTAKAEELFAYLLVNRNANVSKWTLSDQLWPDVQSPKQIENNLHTAVYRMKKTIREAGLAVQISSQRGYYRLECGEWCDYIRFSDAAEKPVEPDGSNAPELAETMRLYKGPLFEHRDYPWCEAERERMSRRFAVLARSLAALHEAAGEHNQAIDVLLYLLSYEPFDEEAHEGLLGAFRSLGDRTSFVAHYNKIKKLYKEELGFDPPAPFMQIYADWHR